MNKWSEWLPFPDPRKFEYLHAPFGPGVYELRHKNGTDYVLFGLSKNVAWRMSSLLPSPLGRGTRTNKEKREYVLRHILDIEYRSMACDSEKTAKVQEKKLKNGSKKYRFPT
jgi:hypothetical protein